MDEVTALKGLEITFIQKHPKPCIMRLSSLCIIILILQRINQKVGDRSAYDRSKRPRFYAALFVSFTWEKVKTHVIRLRVIEGPNTHDQIAFSCIPFILSESSKQCCLHTWSYMLRMPKNNLKIRIAGDHITLRSAAFIWFDSSKEPIPTKSLCTFWRRSKTRTERLIAQVLTDSAFRLNFRRRRMQSLEKNY